MDDRNPQIHKSAIRSQAKTPVSISNWTHIRLDQDVHVERLAEEVVRPGELQFLDLVVLDHARDADDPNVFHRGVGPHAMADFLAVDVRQHHVEDDEVRTVLLDHHPGVEAVGGDAHLEAAVVLEGIVDRRDEVRLVIDEQHLALAALEGIGRDAVVLHELVQRFAGDAPELAMPGTRKPLNCPLSKQRMMVC